MAGESNELAEHSAWVIAIVAIIVVYSRTDARRQTSVDVRNPMDPVLHKR